MYVKGRKYQYEAKQKGVIRSSVKCTPHQSVFEILERSDQKVRHGRGDLARTGRREFIQFSVEKCGLKRQNGSNDRVMT